MNKAKHDASFEGDKGFMDLFYFEHDARDAYQAHRAEAKREGLSLRGWSIQQIKIRAGGVTAERWAVVHNWHRARG